MVMIPRKLNTVIDKENLELHFINDIQGNDRRLRFGHMLPDEGVKDYIKKTFEKFRFGDTDMWFIVDVESPETFGRKVIATCHVHYDSKTSTAELGLTVSPDYRNKKIGQELFTRGITWARMRGAETIFMHCLSENRAIQHIARKGGMTVVTIDPSEKESSITVKKNPVVAGFEDAVFEQMAVYDMLVRNQNWFFTKFMKMFKK
jgi:RimJ/RimL family protein N-acetyltransferase